MNGLHAAEVVVLDNHSEKGGVYQLNVQFLISKSVMEILLKEKNVMRDVVQVCHLTLPLK